MLHNYHLKMDKNFCLTYFNVYSYPFKFESISEEEVSQDEEFSDDDFDYDSEEHVVECSSDCAGMTHE